MRRSNIVLSALTAATVPLLGLGGPAGASAGQRPTPPASSVKLTPQQAMRQFPLVRSEPFGGFTGATCARLQPQFAKLARQGVQRLLCMTSSSRSSFMSRAAFPVACKPGRIEVNRHAACALTAIEFAIVQLPSGTIIGTGTIAFEYREALRSNSRGWPLDVRMELLTATGVAKSGAVAFTFIKCTGGCVAPTALDIPLPLRKIETAEFPVLSHGHATNTTHQSPIVQVIAGGTNGEPTPEPDLGPARCDSIAVAGTSGCVFSNVAGEYVLHLHGHHVNSVARNIKIAETTKPHHFGWFGHGAPLRRAVSARVQRRNRRAACRHRHFKPPLTCDEYPFAATFEGAFYFPHDVRTVGVPGSENSREGALRVNMYKNERLLNDDPYWVFIVP